MSVIKCLTWTCRLDKILERVEPGDLVRFHRGLFVHHAVYVGRGRAVHHHLGPGDGEVIEVTMEYLAKGDLMKVIRVRDTDFSPREIISRARSRIGPLPYSLHDGNCEHFTTWVYHGVRESRQLSGLCRYELQLLQVVKHSESTGPQQQQQQQQLPPRGPDAEAGCDEDEEGDNRATIEAEKDNNKDDDGFVFVPPRPLKYRHTKNPAQIACNHARSCLKVLAVQTVLGLAAVPLYKCSLQADNLQRLGQHFQRRWRRRWGRQQPPHQEQQQ